MTRLKLFSDSWGFLSAPFELLLAAVQVLSGVLYLDGANKPGPLEAQLPHWELKSWVIGFTLGGILTIVSRAALALSRTERALEIGSRMESISMTISGSAISMYAVSIYALGSQAIASGSILAAWAAASFIRLYQIHRVWAPYRKDRKQAESDARR